MLDHLNCSMAGDSGFRVAFAITTQFAFGGLLQFRYINWSPLCVLVFD